MITILCGVCGRGSIFTNTVLFLDPKLRDIPRCPVCASDSVILMSEDRVLENNLPDENKKQVAATHQL